MGITVPNEYKSVKDQVSSINAESSAGLVRPGLVNDDIIILRGVKLRNADVVGVNDTPNKSIALTSTGLVSIEPSIVGMHTVTKISDDVMNAVLSKLQKEGVKMSILDR